VWSERWSDYFLPPSKEIASKELRRCRTLIFVCLLTSLLAAAYLVVSIVVDFPVGVYAMAFSAVVIGGLPFALKRGASRVVVANIYVAVIFIDTVLITSLSGGLSSSITSPYIAIVPMLGLMLINRRAGFIWFLVVVAEILVLGVAEIAGVDFPTTFNEEVDAAFKVAAYLGLVVIVFFIVRDFDRRAEGALDRVEEEQARTQALLLHILPEEVAEELKETGQAKANEFEQVTILFTDFKDFTEISSRMTPADLVAELNTCFYAFDDIVTRHGLEKIKTIGDAYMAASGLSLEDSGSPERVIRAALEMQTFMAGHKEDNDALGRPAFTMRSGVHTGPVVAGVVGETKFQYDVWGDTVNTASRMETAGEAGEVNISELTFELVKGQPGMVFEPRETIEVKGKGELRMFFVRAAGDAGAPTEQSAPLASSDKEPQPHL
jgi:class 3 adenylate cyclase